MIYHLLLCGYFKKIINLSFRIRENSEKISHQKEKNSY